ncbi:MFS transporter [Cronbergia sp. UHCC 0137]|uniref:MFS transporter n=1 Tax=Cronbergia sp. UHCC 0137 TaxID=3110239 RepID=UPI002B20670F|nr:MFS transporter [Cronbergia sp. UHCC 0137]MEA5617127.1 MFS transporter [Cronbergia sp. UHCC 0137]
MKTQQNFGLLGSLYVAQYLPIAFFFQALPVFFRQQGVSLDAIGLIMFLALPWMLKFLWSPLVDRYGWTKWGHYRSWIIAMQSLLVLTLITCAVFDIKENLSMVLIGLFLVCLFASTQDIATDALAIGFLDPSERGFANGIQSGGNYLGGIIGGGGLLILLNLWGWTNSLLVMAFLILLLMIPVLLHQEHPIIRTTERRPNFMTLVNFCRRPRMGTWLLVLLLYMMGSNSTNVMFRSLLVDIGLSLSDIGLLTGVVGYSAGLVGAIFAGFLIKPLGRKRSLIIFGLLQTMSVASLLLPAVGFTALPVLYLVAIAFQLIVSMAYTIVSTIMMDNSSQNTPGTDYTLQVAVLYIGSLAMSGISGFIAEAIGYTGLFAVSTVICLVSVVVTAKIFTTFPTEKLETI